MVTCPRCGASRGDGDRFCEDCGAPLGRCPSCGEPVTPGKPFCRSCGYQLRAERELARARLAANVYPDAMAAAASAGEAAGIAGWLGCQPLADRAETTQPAGPRNAAS